MLPSAYGLGQYFQDLGHSFSPYGPPSRQITYIYGAEFQWFTTFGLYYKEILIVCDFIKHFTL